MERSGSKLRIGRPNKWLQLHTAVYYLRNVSYHDLSIRHLFHNLYTSAIRWLHRAWIWRIIYFQDIGEFSSKPDVCPAWHCCCFCLCPYLLCILWIIIFESSDASKCLFMLSSVYSYMCYVLRSFCSSVFECVVAAQHTIQIHLFSFLHFDVLCHLVEP